MQIILHVAIINCLVESGKEAEANARHRSILARKSHVEDDYNSNTKSVE